jgi:formylglycine-generating enzyme required for sulfatase activity/3',5'-cyclic AMP phosphodiesterase CpdA
MKTVTWLHLSDLHFRASEQNRWNENIVLRALLVDLRERMASDGLRPDLILVSGDIAFSGKPEEYALARQFFDDLLGALGLSKERLFIVPGNHDVDRSAITRGAATIAASLNDRQSIAEVLTADDDRRLIMRRFNSYADFVNSYLAGHQAFDDEHYFYAQQLDLKAGPVAVLGLNSAWLSGSDQDLGHLALGERQVRQALESVGKGNLRIALLHHPLEWCQEFDRNDCEPLLMQACDLILHGHLHRTGLLSLTTPDAGAMVIAAGACYETRQYPNGYNLVQFNVEAGQGTVYLRRYSDERGGFWTKDVMTYRNIEDGIYPFRLSTRGSDRVESKYRATVIGNGAIAQGAGARAAGAGGVVADTIHGSVTITNVEKQEAHAPAIDPARLEEAYLRRLLVVCNALPLAVIDPRAVERTRQQTMDLMAVYVALQTRTQVPIQGKGKSKKQRGQQAIAAELERQTRSLSALEAADQNQLMALLGDPGSGKSTFANYLALCLAGARLSPDGEWLAHLQPAWTHGELLPVRVTLRHLAASPHFDGTANGLWLFIADTLTAESLADYAPYLRQRLLEGGVVVLFDGLDEVAEPEARKTVRAAVMDFARTYNHPTNRYLVTCRSYAYQDPGCQLDHFMAYEIAPFNQEQIDAFIGCWYKEVCRLGWKSEADAEELTGRLQAATHRPDLAPMAASPLQLAMMASLHFSWGRLPDDRAELYQEMVRLLLVRWQEARLGQETGVTLTLSTGKLESALARVAFIAHRAQEKAEGAADIGEATLLSVLKDDLDGRWDRAQELVTYMRERAGLLMERGPQVYTFPHRSYQEYLAGSYLAGQPEFPDEAANLVRSNYAQWREVVLWAVDVMVRLKQLPYLAVDVAAAFCPRPVPAPGVTVAEADWRMAALAGEMLLEIGLKQVLSRERHEPVLVRVREWLTALIERETLPAVERAEAGRALGKLGDPRPEVVTLEGMQLCYVPPGPFWMGSDEPDSRTILPEGPPHQVNLASYWMARYPMTNAQFAEFVAAGGYTEPRYWQEAKEAKVWQSGQLTCRSWNPTAGNYERETVNTPKDYGEPFNLPNHPVVGITWYEALAFTRWLNERLAQSKLLKRGWQVRLPTEAEWEKAARGGLEIPAEPAISGWQMNAPQRPLLPNPAPQRRYPWSGDKADGNRANYGDTQIGTTSTPGCFLGGASPYGVLDMSGNVWEWTQSINKDYPYDPKDGRESLEAGTDIARVLRGSAFFDGGHIVRCAVRNRNNPASRNRYDGFRVVLSPL